jgi:hypothetical protein
MRSHMHSAEGASLYSPTADMRGIQFSLLLAAGLCRHILIEL